MPTYVTNSFQPLCALAWAPRTKPSDWNANVITSRCRLNGWPLERRWLSLVIAASISTIHELKVATNMTQIAFKLFTLAAVARQLPLTHQPSNWPITLLTCDRNAISPIVALLLPLFFIMFFCKNRNAIKINKSGLLWTKTAKTQKKEKRERKTKIQ